ncbi:hypothetical protein QN239_01000 [Mycolicibacterium sp. Y3]
MAFLKYALFARSVEKAGPSSLNLTEAFMTGLAAPAFPASGTFWVVGEYQFAKEDQGAEHAITVECTLPDGGPAPFDSTTATYAPWTIHQDGDNLAPAIYAINVQIHAASPGTYTVHLVVDGERVFRLPFIVALEDASPDSPAALVDP